MIGWLMLSTKVGQLPIAQSSYMNNLGHAFVFGVEALLLGVLWRPGQVGRPAKLWFALGLVALAYAGFLEWRQMSVPGRMGSLADMVTNAVGALGTGYALADGRLLCPRILGVAAAALASAAVATWPLI
ncbi:MAG: hypothetical protein ACI9EF_003475 [Pseudohongiellaceae bacterium]|jgi:hypothetical protein